MECLLDTSQMCPRRGSASMPTARHGRTESGSPLIHFMVSGDSLMDWSADGCLLPAEIIRSFVLPLLGAQDENVVRR